MFEGIRNSFQSLREGMKRWLRRVVAFDASPVGEEEVKEFWQTLNDPFPAWR